MNANYSYLTCLDIIFFVSKGTVGSNSNSMGLANWLDAWRPREIPKHCMQLINEDIG